MINIYRLKAKIAEIARPCRRETAITFFQVKTLYNEAYEQKARARIALRRFKRMEAQARRLEDAYRAQVNLSQRAA